MTAAKPETKGRTLMPRGGTADKVAYRKDVMDAADKAFRTIGELRDYVLAVRSCLGTGKAYPGSLPVPEDHERITTKLTDVDVAVAQLLALVANHPTQPHRRREPSV